jgi:hypothetical protein
MVREAIITKAVLAGVNGDSLARDRLLIRTLGVTQDEIDSCRVGYIEQRILYAADLLKNKGYPSEIKSYTLGALIEEEWSTPLKASSKVGNWLRERYSRDRIRIAKEVDLKVTNTHLLREEVGAYTGNLVEAKRVWPHLEAGVNDWLRSVTIPTTIDARVALLLGIYWGDAYVYMRRGRTLVGVAGSEKDVDFYKATVAPLVEEVHHITEHVRIIDKKSKASGRDVKSPQCVVASKAVASWVKSDLDHSGNRKKLQLPKGIDLEDSKIRDGFVSGIIATSAILNRSSRSIFFSDSDRTFIDGIERLLTGYGLSSRRKVTGRRNLLWLSPSNTQQLAKRGLLINSRHKF